ncbi:mechanosensitive ion channel family protein [Oceanobacillus piezotolerans]|uniref:Mechanosensitive ion channel family protein n=1 Tax=Oceanobacillus piezotolerans TaxID=2448030 RepID=A0A498D449_9BACI|nr:mechanosensitive ion channel family protein [Oceanobacillus piezotolerans]RLL41287.1 mechanosensitive ion channel family protein [Oceanobacillus piezotolerans]
MTWEYFLSIEHWTELGIAFGIFFLFLLFRKLFTKYVFVLFVRVIKKTRINVLSNILYAFEKPMQFFFIVIGFHVAITYYGLSLGYNISYLEFSKILKVSFIILVTWGLLRLSSSSSSLFRKINERTDLNIDEILIPLLSKTLQFIIFAIALTIVLQEFGYNIQGFIAGLGLGGLAISLAAKDTIGNLFGGIIIISEKPFTIGDWIMTPSVEGTVEDITFRSTKIRTFQQALVTVPNATLAGENITNWSKMGKRQINFNLALAYETPKEKIQTAIQSIEALLRGHSGIDQEAINVKFDAFNVSSLDILINFFTKSTDYDEYIVIKEEINYRILEIIREEGIQFAYPTRRLYVESEGERENSLRMRDEN